MIKININQKDPHKMEVDLTKLSAEELRKALAKAEEKEKRAREKAKKVYEEERNLQVISLCEEAEKLSKLLVAFNLKVEEVMEKQALSLAEYGQMRSNSKGGFSIRNEKDTKKVIRTRQTNPNWDERSTKGVELIRDFLHDTVKKRAEKEFNLIMSFLEKNQQGDLEYAKVMMLLSHEENYTDERWKEGLRLLKESYNVTLKGFGYYFEIKNSKGKWETIPLNFSSI